MLRDNLDFDLGYDGPRGSVFPQVSTDDMASSLVQSLVSAFSIVTASAFAVKIQKTLDRFETNPHGPDEFFIKLHAKLIADLGSKRNITKRALNCGLVLFSAFIQLNQTKAIRMCFHLIAELFHFGRSRIKDQAVILAALGSSARSSPTIDHLHEVCAITFAIAVVHAPLGTNTCVGTCLATFGKLEYTKSAKYSLAMFGGLLVL